MNLKHFLPLSILLIVLSLTSCKEQEYQSEILDLSKLDFDLDADQFYSKAMNRENIKLTSEKQYVEKDTVSEYDQIWQGDKEKIFGIQFDVKSYSKKDSVAKYENLIFYSLEAMTTEKGDLMLMSAIGECSNDDFNIFIQKITDKYEPPFAEKIEFSFFKTYHYTWKLNDRILQLVSEAEIDFNQTPYNILTDEEKRNIKNASKDQLNEVHLFICKAEYEEKLRRKMKRGDWSSFK